MKFPRTFAIAIGLIAGPDNPPVIFWILGFRVKILNAAPTKVFIAETASAPFSFAALANSAIYETFGESLIINGLFVDCSELSL